MSTTFDDIQPVLYVQHESLHARDKQLSVALGNYNAAFIRVMTLFSTIYSQQAFTAYDAESIESAISKLDDACILLSHAIKDVRSDLAQVNEFTQSIISEKFE